MQTSKLKPNFARGEDNARAKLGADAVVRMRALYKTGLLSQPELGRAFRVHHSVVGRVCRRITWSHIP